MKEKLKKVGEKFGVFTYIYLLCPENRSLTGTDPVRERVAEATVGGSVYLRSQPGWRKRRDPE